MGRSEEPVHNDAGAPGLLSGMGALFGFCHERVAGKGEDACCYSFNERGGVMAVFDGCGGSGAESYARLGGHTGAWLASRAAAAATMTWFDGLEYDTEPDSPALHDKIVGFLGLCERYAEQTRSKIRGSITREMPTTMAGFVLQDTGERLVASAVAAGDSRLYVLDAGGLRQVSVDDVAGGDAFTNLYDDPPMTQVVSRDGGFELRWSTFSLDEDCVLVAATDGCFGYFKSPMEFELALLDALAQSRSVDEWQDRLAVAVDEVAGDDQTLLAVVWGYQGFDALKRSLEPRRVRLADALSGVAGVGAADGDAASVADETAFELRKQIWERYRDDYYSLAPGGVPGL